jgi:hypothetical protein
MLGVRKLRPCLVLISMQRSAAVGEGGSRAPAWTISTAQTGALSTV